MNGDLISRSALLEKATNVTKYDEGGWDMDLRAVQVEDIENAPAVDVDSEYKHSFEMIAAKYAKIQDKMLKGEMVEVVRCKDCKHSYKGSPHGLMCECPVGGQNTSLLGDDDFCSCGERRADDDQA